MNRPTQEDYLDAFYAWEVWGRGWLRSSTPIELEPPLLQPPWWSEAFERPIYDDTKRHSWISALFEGVKSQSGRQEQTELASINDDFTRQAISSLKPAKAHDYHELSFSLPEKERFSEYQSLTLAHHLYGFRTPLSFELVHESGETTIRFASTKRDHTQLVSSLRMVAPEASLHQGRSLLEILENTEAQYLTGFEYGLGREYLIPLGSSPRELDRISAIARVFSLLHENEVAIFQVLVQPASSHWDSAIELGVCNRDGRALFGGSEWFLDQAEEKASNQMFAVALRLLLCTDSSHRAFDLAHSLNTSLNATPERIANYLVPLSDVDVKDLAHSVITRQSNRLGMILSGQELSNLVCLPYEVSNIPNLWRAGKYRSVPRINEQSYYLGETLDGQALTLASEDALKHLHVVGATGSGKSNFLLSLIKQDLEAGRGIAVVDPHGDLVETVASVMPEDRLSDTVLLDPTYETHAVGWNVLEAHSDIEQTIISSDLVAVFERLSTSWGDQMTAVLGNAVMAFLHSTRGGTLADLRRFLIDESYRAGFLATVTDPYIREFWQIEWSLLANRRPQAPILTRLDAILRHKQVRETLTLPERGLDFRDVIDSQKVLLARLPRGLLGGENTSLIASLLLSKLYQTGMSRQSAGKSERAPFMIYIDEFQHFATPSLANLFAELRKYGLGLVIAHQDLHQLSRAGSAVESAVLGNSYTRVAFRTAERDAKQLSTGFAHYELSDLTSLSVGEAIVRLGSSERDYAIQTPLVEVSGGVGLEAIREHSRARYGLKRASLRDRQAVELQPPAQAKKPEEPSVAKPRATPSSPKPTSPPAPLPRSAEVVQPDLAVKQAIPEEGRGGPEHRYLQSLIRSWAQERGYKADLEVELEAGGRVDLVIQRRQERIAVEVSVTTSVAHEIENAKKCLEAGFDQVILVSNKKRFRTQLQNALSEIESSKLLVLTPESLLSLLSESPVQTGTVAGYNVRTTGASKAGEIDQKRDRLSAIIASSLSRINREGK